MRLSKFDWWYLRYSSRVQILNVEKFIDKKLLEPLIGQVISIECTDLTQKKLFFKFDSNSIKLVKATTADTTITGPLLGFIKLARDHNTSLHAAKIIIYGNLTTAEQLQNLLKNLDFDLEEEISKYTGDIIAHQLGNFGRRLKNNLEYNLEDLNQMFTDYLQQEKLFLPTQYEINQFLDQVDDLRCRVDRLEARINQCE